jgi:hypothetical protein
MRATENRVLRKIFARQREEATGGRRKLHNEELHNFYASPNVIRAVISRRVRWAGHVARPTHGTDEKQIQNYNRSEENKPLRRPKHRRQCNIKMDLEKLVGWEVANWIHLT